jgi:membrane protein involved in colicin uptake
MLMKVTALKTFTGKAGLIRQGSRPDLDEDYVKDLEREGLVSRRDVKPAPAMLTKADQEAQAKTAAEQEALKAKAAANEKADEEAKAKAMEEAKAKEEAAAKQEKATK